MPAESTEATFSKKIQEQTATTAFQVVWGWIGKLGNKVWDEKAIRSATRGYAAHYAARHGSVKVLGMPAPVSLHDVYTAVRVVPPHFLSAFVRQKDMEEEFKRTRKQPAFTGHNVEDGIAVANREPLLNILGAPGSGKSTFLRRLGQEALLARGIGDRLDPSDADLDSKYEHALLPVLVELHDFKTKPIDLVVRIAEEFATGKFPESAGFTSRALERGKLLVLLDGLDEVPDDKVGTVIDHIRDFVDTHAPAGNRFVTSCRTAHYKSAFPRFVDVVLADFSDGQIERFAKNWFDGLNHRQAETAAKFVAVLKEPTNASVLELARTPLLLTFLCITYGYGELPPTRATLYRRALDLLLREWAASKRVHDEPVYRELNVELEQAMLAQHAAELFRADRFFFTRDEVTGHIRKFMSEQLGAPKTLDAVKILEAIEKQQGLIVNRAQDTYSFSHLTIQEYLTAKYLWDEGERVWRLAISDHLSSERWRVPFELMAGLGQADHLLLAMAETAQQRLALVCDEGEDAKALVNWAMRHTINGSESDVIVLALTRTLALALALSLDLALDLELALTPDMTRAGELANALVLALDTCRDLARAREIPLSRSLASYSHIAGTHASGKISDLASANASTRSQVRSIVSDLSFGLALDFKNKSTQQSHTDLCKLVAGKIQSRSATESGEIKMARANSRPLISPVFLVGLTTYLTSLNHIISCKRSVFQLSTRTWEVICETFVRMPEPFRTTE